MYNAQPSLPLAAPDNGNIDCELGDDGEANVGDTCTFTCNDGFELTGNDSRSCQIDESWSGTETMCIQVIGMLLCNTFTSQIKVILEDTFAMYTSKQGDI